jgi:fido (protein-threonine AMPylation protein)
LRAILRQIFQDVYDWAGDVRTVGIEKGDESFCPPGSIGQPMDHVAAEIHRLKQLKAVPEADLARTVAEGRTTGGQRCRDWSQLSRCCHIDGVHAAGLMMV